MTSQTTLIKACYWPLCEGMGAATAVRVVQAIHLVPLLLVELTTPTSVYQDSSDRLMPHCHQQVSDTVSYLCLSSLWS